MEETKPKIVTFDCGDNVYYCETNYVAGEPGSPGNWSKEFYDEMKEKFMNIGKK
jgi:hypothetical protein